MGSKNPVDTKRCVVHIDVDAFYAQCEEIRNPALRERPLGITQKYLLVTSNYPARKRGVTKLMGITEAQQMCPDLVLVSGEDLTPYRQASKRILSVLQRFGICERGGMDEMLVDVTAEVERRIAQGSVPTTWAAHVHSNKVGLVADNKHRPMDLRVLALRGAVTSVTAAGPGLPLEEWQPLGQAWEPLLMTGCVIAQEMRAVLKAEAGFRCSAGISSNRMLAKLVSGLHKPDDQTVLLPPDALDFVGPLPVRALPGVGYKMGNELDRMGIKTAADLRQVSQETLVQKFGERVGTFLQLACRGQDPTAVHDKGPPKSITVEDSFKDCSSLQSAEHVIRVLSPDLLARMVEDYQETGRRAGALTLKWRHRGSGWGRSSSSCPMPNPLLNPQLDDPSQVSLLGTTLMTLLKKNIAEPFQLTLLNIGVANFVGTKGGTGGKGPGWDPAFAKLMGTTAKRQKLNLPQLALPLNGASDSRSAALKSLNQRRDYGAQPKAACISKSTERALREEGRLQQQPSRAATGNELDCLDWEEEEDWGDQILDAGHAWEPAGLVRQPARQAQNHPPGIAMHIQQPHQWQQHQQLQQQQQPQQQQTQQQQAQQQQQQQLPPADNAHLANASCSHQILRQTSVAQQQNEAVSPLSPRGTSLLSDDIAASAAADAAAAANHAQHTGAADGIFDAMHLLGRGQSLCQMSAQPGPPDTESDVCHDNAAPLQNTGAGAEGQPAMSMQSAITTEQSDYELALRLQAQEHAMHRQHSRPVVTSRVGVKQKQRQTSGTLHAFFKQA